MKKVSTAVAKQNRNISQQKLTIGLDLGDRNSWYCVMDETGHIQLEQRVRTTAKALREVFGVMPRSLDIVTTAQACLVSRFEWRCRNRNRSATEMEKTKSTKLIEGTSEPSALLAPQGLEVKQLVPTSGRGRSIFLDIPLL